MLSINRVKQRYRYSVVLLRAIVKTDFKLRYQGSTLGYIWSLLRPLLMFLVLYLVFTVFLPVGKGVPYYPVYLLFGIVLWNYFGEATTGSLGSIVGKGDLLRKLSFPRYVIVLAGSFSALINLLLNFVVIGIFMIFLRVPLHWSALFIFPLILELFVASLAMALILSALFVKFRDVQYIWDVLMQAGFYGTPIIYPLQRIPHHVVQKLLILNPIAQIIQDGRYVFITNQTLTISQLYHGGWARLVPVGIIIVIAIFSVVYFKKQSRYFAEEV
jgi:ABC-2 type transport system permease protein